MSWEQDISQLLQTLEKAAVRFDIEQDLTETQQEIAKANISYGASTSQIEGNDYKITLQ